MNDSYEPRKVPVKLKKLICTIIDENNRVVRVESTCLPVEADITGDFIFQFLTKHGVYLEVTTNFLVKDPEDPTKWAIQSID